MRKFRFTNGEYYHVYNRGTDKRNIFLDDYDFVRFLQSMDEFNSVKPIGSIFEYAFRKSQLGNRIAKLVDIVSFCLNPNHFHLILRQRVENGISEYMRRMGTGFTQYFNLKYKRTGVLFQGKFKAKHIDSNEYLLHLSAYVNLNNRVHKIGSRERFRSSWNDYFSQNKPEFKICNSSVVLGQFDNKSEYKKFAENSLQNILERKRLFNEMENLLMED